ncbi:NAD(P)-binding protein [Mollisia scopiformis]|uniref:NAD(P)-binding protein n=1 Tax=Mollisia scopiformis TaxID=149040 RepID=A0A194XFQ7_MOLSC|nr:NAD(P)-binding protein [Mollisia scopiformis]KUJ18607.1 NAD(P)-binding protein [Mollisia scopiformis]
MVVVAVAGGTDAVGRSIVESLMAQGKHEVLILSRTANPMKEKETGARLVAVDYEEVAALTKILEDNNAHTIISTLAMMPNDAGSLEQNLIQAANTSKMTKRFVPSEFGFPQRAEDGHIFPTIPMKQASRSALEASSLEWTVVYNGYFMDYFGMPQLASRLAPYVVLLDIPGNAAAIPGDGNKLVTFTHTSDVGRFVTALIDFEEWDRVSFIIGDKMTLNEAVKLAEVAKGSKFKVDYDDLDKLKRGEVTELPSQISSYSVIPREFVQAINSAFGIWVDRGDFDFDEKTSLNTNFPDIKPMKLKELLEKAWKN